MSASPPKKMPKLHHHTLESAKLDLLKARERVAELEKLVECLEEEDVKQQQNASAVPCNDMHLALQGPTLRVAIGWLDTKDTLSCIKTCRQWKHDVDQQKVWEQTALIQSPTLFNKIKAKNPSCNFKKLAVGSAHKGDDFWYFADEPHQVVLGPSLRAEDVFLLIEAKDRVCGKVIARWDLCFTEAADDLTSFMFLESPGADERVFLTPESEGDLSDVDGEEVHDNISPSFVVSCRFFRCDTEQSVGFMFENPHDETASVSLSTGEGCFAAHFNRDFSVMPFASNDAGRRAFQVWSTLDVVGEWALHCFLLESYDSANGPPEYYFDEVHGKLSFGCLEFAEGEQDMSSRDVLMLLDGLDWK